RELDFDALPSAVPTRVSQALRLCLRKDPKQRVADIRDVRLALDGAFETTAPQATSSAPTSTRGERLAQVAAAIGLVAAVALATPAMRHLRERPSPEMRVEINTPRTPLLLHFSLSPDGMRLAFVASGNGPQRLWVRSLDAIAAQPLVGTESATYPFWSPDSG